MDKIPDPQLIVNIKGWTTTSPNQSHYQATLQDGRILSLTREDFNAALTHIRQDPRLILSQAPCAELGYAYNVRRLQPVANSVTTVSHHPQLATRDSFLTDFIIQSEQARYAHRSPITGHFRGGDRGGK